MTDDEMNDFCQKLPMTYGEQGADTDGTAMESVFWLGPDGLTCNGEPVATQMVEWSERSDPTIWLTMADAERIPELEARIARKEAANEALTKRVIAQDAKMAATMADMRSLRALADERQIECKRLSDLLVAQEEKSREAVVTDSEKAADQMRQDILGGKIDKAGRQVVRDACDKMDAPKTGRDASNDALGNISRRGGW